MRGLAARARSMCFLTLPLLLLLLGAATPTPPKAPPGWLWGCWVVTRVLPISGSFGVSPKQEKAIIGTRIVFTPTYARSGPIVLRSPKYSVKVLSAREFFKLGYVPLGQIGIHDPDVTWVELDLPGNLSDLDFPGSDVFLRKTDIVIMVEGDYFVAERAKPNDPECKCGGPRVK